MAVPVACLHGSGLRAWSRSPPTDRRPCWTGLAEAALPAATASRRSWASSRRRSTASGSVGRAPMAAATPTTAAIDCRRDREGGRPAGARCNTRANEGTGWDPKGPASIHRAARGDRRLRQGHRLRVLQQGLLARRRQHQRQPAAATRWPATSAASTLKSGDDFGVPAESYAFANKKTAWETIAPLLDRASPLRTSHLRDPVGPADPLRQRVLHGRGRPCARRRSARVAAAARQGPARRRGAPGGGGEGRLAVAAVAATRARPATRSTGRGIAYARAQRHDRCDRRRGRGRPHDRQDLGAASSRSRTTAARSSTRMGSSTRSRATSSRASAARSGKRSSSTPRA